MSAQNESMYTQYLAWYQRYLAKYGPQTAVLMQVGKFFEIYDRLDLTTNSTNTNIRELADLCSLNLSESRESDTMLKLFGGFPEPSLPKFERQLLDAGYTVVVVVQKKNEKGDVEERSVERISSPGIYENRYSGLSRLETKDSFLVGILMEPNDNKSLCVGLTAVDIQTGMTWSTETIIPFLQGTPNIDSVEPFLLRYPPAEIVCWSATASAAEIRGWFRLGASPLIHMRREQIGLPIATFMREAFTMKANLQPHIVLGLEKYPQAYKSMGATLKFIEDHIPSLLKKLRNTAVWVSEDRVRLGNAALEQLNIVSNSNECLLFWLDKTFTSLGRRALRERILSPISNVAELETRFRRITNLGNHDFEIEKSLRTVYDLSRLHRKVHLNTLSLQDVRHLLLTYRAIHTLLLKFEGTPNSISYGKEVKSWLVQIENSWDLQRISTAELELERTHPWPLGLYPDLDMIEASWKAVIKEANEFAAANSDPGIPINLIPGEFVPFEFTMTRKRFEKFSRRNEFQFNSATSKSSTGSIESTKSKALVLKAIGIRRAWNSRQDEIWLQAQQIWSTSCDIYVGSKPIADAITEWIGNLDVEFALARISHEFNFVIPKFVNSINSSVQVQGLRHPIIERIHTASPYVKHDISLGLEPQTVGSAESGLLLYGTNASGKSSLMKALGLAVLCAQTGIPVAANSIEICPYTSVFTRILGNDNLWAALSSFAVEMTEFRSILKYADNRSLILGDELCSGTETQSATAIVSAGIQILAKRRAQFLFATHLHEISELEEIRQLEGVKFAHLGIEYNAATKQIVYKRTLEPGAGSSLYGLEVCYGLDMDAEFLALATKARSSKSRYNSAVEVRSCEVCRSVKDLETHHIQHQATAVNGFVSPGTPVHRASNLTVLCGLCHDKHHRGEIVIHGWRDTSTGRELEWSEQKPSPARADVEREDRFDLVKDRLRILISKKTKEKDIITTFEREGYPCTVGELRGWKKRL